MSTNFLAKHAERKRANKKKMLRESNVTHRIYLADYYGWEKFCDKFWHTSSSTFHHIKHWQTPEIMQCTILLSLHIYRMHIFFSHTHTRIHLYTHMHKYTYKRQILYKTKRRRETAMVPIFGSPYNWCGLLIRVELWWWPFRLSCVWRWTKKFLVYIAALCCEIFNFIYFIFSSNSIFPLFSCLQYEFQCLPRF